jgi:hypothetical protein
MVREADGAGLELLTEAFSTSSTSLATIGVGVKHSFPSRGSKRAASIQIGSYF